MKNNTAFYFRKIISLILVLVLATCLFAGCGKQESKITGVFLSPATLFYQNMRPQYNYFVTAFTQETLILNDDNTYCLIISSSAFSALELSENTSYIKGNERSNVTMMLYGTYTSKPNELDDHLLDVSLGKVTRVINAVDQKYYLDTDNWTEDMGKAVTPPSGYDENGQAVKDPNAAPWTAEQYLESIVLTNADIQVNIKHASFDFTDFGVFAVSMT